MQRRRRTTWKKKEDIEAENLPRTINKGIPIETLIEYKEKGLTTREIAELVGCAQPTVVQRLKNVDLEGLSHFRKNKDVVFEHKQREILDALSPAQINDMSGYHKVLTASILQDKIAAMRGEATQIVDHRVLYADVEGIIQRLGGQLPAANAEDADVIDVPS